MLGHTAEARIDQKIDTLEGELRCAAVRKEKALQDLARAWGGVETAEAAFQRASNDVRDRFEDLCKARDVKAELLLPAPREASD